MNQTLSIPQRAKRTFIAEDFDGSTWQAIEPYCNNLLNREINTLDALNQWLLDWSEFDAVMGEQFRWIYVRTTLDTSDEKAKAELMNQYANVFPKLSVQENLLKKKFVDCQFVSELNQDIFFTTIRRIKSSLEIFREENIPLQSELQMKQSNYDQIAGAQSITYKGKDYTIQQASVFLKSTDRAEREEVYKLISERKFQDADKLDELMSELIQLRHKIALNAGFKNYLEYRFAELGRFDYTPQDCLNFHDTMQQVLMPLVNEASLERAQLLGLDVLKPWDREVDTSGKPALRPCETTEELTNKTIECFTRLNKYFGERIAIMQQMNYLDLGSRMNKGPGGYNMTMPEIGVPFIFMNAANTESDVITMVHEGGHAIHTFLSHSLALTAFKETTSEIAEVASMGMELMSMEHWDVFYPVADDLKRAKKNHLKYILSVLTKTCMGDSFQFWMYLNPDHTTEARRNKWAELQTRYNATNIDWSGMELYNATGYQSILHFYVVPFYYIEYAFAELGALAVWRSFKQDASKAIEDYKNALRLGYTKPIPVFYETAGAKFDFSKAYINGLISFLRDEISKL